jgi:hypothetical protein
VLPYTAHFKITQTIVMPDGKTLTYVSIETAARDSKGRFYSETKNAQDSEDSEPDKVATFVSDPAAGTQLIWNSKSNRAVLYQTPEELHGKLKGCWANNQGIIRVRGPEDADWHPIPISSSSISQSKTWIREPEGIRRQVLLITQNLGTKTISGFIVQGVRMSYAPLPGEQPDGVTESSAEFWRSDALNLKLSEKSTGRLYGNKAESIKTKELIDLKLGEPDPSLFSPPNDYSVDRVELHKIPCDQN